jgi:hypothetical protein
MTYIQRRPGGLGTLSSSLSSQIQSAIPQYCPSCPPSLVNALVNVESSGNPSAVSPDGAIGLFQLMPGTAAGLNVNPADVSGNIQGGLTYLQQLYDQYGNWTQALEAYNEGPGNLAANLNAGITPVSAGYASSILTQAGLSPVGIDTSVTGDSSVSSPSSPSVFSDLLSYVPDTTSLSWPFLALIGVGLFTAAYALG